MKRNPNYSRPSKWIFPIIVNGLVITENSNTFTDKNGVEYNVFSTGWNNVDMCGDVIMPGAFKSWDDSRKHFKEAKQEKFNRIFNVEDAKLVK